MRRLISPLLIPLLLLACWTGSALAQMGMGRRLYDPATEVTVKGTVEKVTETAGRRGWNGLHLTLQTEGPVYAVHVGPAAYVKRNGFTFSAGDRIEVTGSKVGIGGTETILAREIKKDGQVLTLRTSQGIPLWSRGRRRSY